MRGSRSPFPPRAVATVRVDSVGEEYAYVAAWPSSKGAWELVSQLRVTGADGPENHVVLRAPDGTTEVIRFATGAFADKPDGRELAPVDRASDAMRAGHELAKTEGPLHPGTMPQYPVPSPTHAGTVAVPLTILAVDAGQRGLYAPPRVAVVRWPSTEAVGVGDVPGFDPNRRPPPRPGDWPPATVRDWDQIHLAGAIERFTGVWSRLLDAWFAGESSPSLADEKREALLLLGLLLPAALLEFYADLSPRYWEWLSDSSLLVGK